MPEVDPTGGEKAAAKRQPISRQAWAWAMYDWANSAYSSLLITIVLGYFQHLVFAVPETASKTEKAFGGKVYAWGIAGSMLAAAFASPILGALADAQRSKRFWLGVTALGGAACALTLGFIPTQNQWLITGMFVLMSLLFELSLGIYNAFLPEIASEDETDRISAVGFALGYLGGGIALAIALAFFAYIEDTAAAIKAGLILLGVWWALFTLPTLLVLRDKPGVKRGSGGLVKAAGNAWKEVLTTIRHVRLYRNLAIFLLAFLLYNDGVQTVISQASQFATLDLKFTTPELTQVILMIQFMSVPGAIAVGWLSKKFGPKNMLHLCLLIWAVLLGVAFFIDAKWQFWIMGGVVALVMGGTQSVSRALMARMTPPERSAEFFGFFNLSGKATSFGGTFVFGLILSSTGNARLATLALLPWILLGWLLASFVNVRQGQIEAGTQSP